MANIKTPKNNSKKASGQNKFESCNAFYIFLIIITIIIIAFNILIQSRIYNFDGMVYALQMKAASEGKDILKLYSPYHMLYLPAMFGIFKAAHSMEIASDPLNFLRSLNLIIGLFSAALFFVFCRKRFQSTAPAAFAALLFIASFSVWFMSHESETYILTVAIILLLFFAMFDYRPQGWSTPKALLVGFLLGFSILGHITAALLAFPVLYFIIKNSERKLKALILTFSSSFITILAGFLPIITRTQFSKLSDFSSWFFQAISYREIYGENVNFWEIGAGSIAQTFVSTFDSIVSKFNYVKLNSGFFIFFRIIIAAAFIYCLILLIIKRRKIADDNKHLLKVALYWLIPFTVFYTFWGTSHFKFRILVLPAVIMLFTAGIFSGEPRKDKSKWKALPIIILLLVFSFNTLVSIIPAGSINANPDLLKAKWIKETTPPSSCVIIFGLENRGYEFGKVYIDYFSERNVIILSWLINQSGSEMNRVSNFMVKLYSSGRSLFVLNEVFDDAIGKQMLAARTGFKNPKEIDQMFINFNWAVWNKMSDDFYLYKLTLKSF